MSAADSVYSAARAWYFDGQSGARLQATAVYTPTGIEFSANGGPVQFWANGTWRSVVEPSFRRARIERLPYSGEALVVEDTDFVRSLSPKLSINAAIHRRRFAALSALAAISAALGAGIWIGYPYLTDKVALVLPLALEEQLGSAVASGLARDELEGQSIDGPMETLVGRLDRSRPSPYTWRVKITNDWDVNAWAAPGGYIGIHRGLVCAMESPDQLAGVLAHEMTHGIERHSTRNLVRMLGVRLAIALVAGGGDTLLDTATMVGSLNYMRGDEEAADRGAVEWLVRARIDPAALSTAFERLAEETPDMPGALQYLSTHPPLSQRRTEAIAAARRAKSQGVIEWLPALTPISWRQLRTGCMCSED